MKKHIRFQLSVCLLLFPCLLCAQKGFRVTGIVTDMGGEPVTGVSVVCSANRQGTITNSDGSYSIVAASADAALENVTVNENGKIDFNDKSVTESTPA